MSPGAVTRAQARRLLAAASPPRTPVLVEGPQAVDDLGGAGLPRIDGRGQADAGDCTDPGPVVVGHPAHSHPGGRHTRGAFAQVVEGDLSQLGLLGHTAGAVGARGQDIGTPSLASDLEVGEPAGVADRGCQLQLEQPVGDRLAG